MRKHLFIWINNVQQGFTLIEIVIVLGVALVLAGATVMSINQVISVNSTSSSHMTAVKEVENAVYYLTRDVQMAQQVNASSSSGFPLTLNWVEWSGNSDTVTYSINSGRMERSLSVNGSTPTVMVIIAHVDTSRTNCNPGDKTLAVRITSKVTGLRPESETRSFTIVRRTGQ